MAEIAPLVVQKIVELDGVKLIVLVLRMSVVAFRKEPASPLAKLVCNGCHLVRILSSDLRNRKEIATNGGCVALLAAIKHYMQSCSREDGSAKPSSSSLYDKQHEDERAVIEQAARAVGNLCSKTLLDSEDHGQIRYMMGTQIGGVQVLLQVIRDVASHPYTGDILSPVQPRLASVAKRVLIALGNLCHECLDNSETAGNINGCEILLALLRAMQHDQCIVELVCAVLNNLTQTTTNRERVGSAGGCEQLLELLKVYIECPKIIEYSCMVIFNLSSIPSNKLKLLALQVDKRIEQVLAVNSSQGKLVHEARDVLSKIGAGELGCRGKEVCVVS